MKQKLRFLFRRFHRDESGFVMILMPFLLIIFLGFSALTVDVGYLYYVKQRLQSTANSAVLAAASYVSEVCSSSTSCTGYQNATQAANTYIAANWANSLSSGTPPAYTLTGKCLTSLAAAGAVCSPTSTAGLPQYNSLSLNLSVTAPTFFARVLGITSEPISVTAFAAAKGSTPNPLNVMMVLDTTASMSSSDAACAGKTRIACALQGVQVLLSQLWPSQDQVGLMIFPGLTNVSDVSKEYTCGNTISSSMISPYYSGEHLGTPTYQIIGSSSAGSTDYRVQTTGNPPSTGLNSASNLVNAVGGGSCSAGVKAIGGVGTFYADVIAEAQNILTAWHNANGRQNVLVLLGDGDVVANNNSSHPTNICCDTTATSLQTIRINYQCQEAVTAAKAAADAGTWVYSIAYGASTSSSNSCQYDRSPLSPIGGKTYPSKPVSACTTMTNMASDATKFYSDDANGCVSAANPSMTSLNSIFHHIGQNLTYARLINSAVFSGPAS